jgi:hypothetical protein
MSEEFEGASNEGLRNAAGATLAGLPERPSSVEDRADLGCMAGLHERTRTTPPSIVVRSALLPPPYKNELATSSGRQCRRTGG